MKLDEFFFAFNWNFHSSIIFILSFLFHSKLIPTVCVCLIVRFTCKFFSIGSLIFSLFTGILVFADNAKLQIFTQQTTTSVVRWSTTRKSSKTFSLFHTQIAQYFPVNDGDVRWCHIHLMKLLIASTFCEFRQKKSMRINETSFRCDLWTRHKGLIVLFVRQKFNKQKAIVGAWKWLVNYEPVHRFSVQFWVGSM